MLSAHYNGLNNQSLFALLFKKKKRRLLRDCGTTMNTLIQRYAKLTRKAKLLIRPQQIAVLSPEFESRSFHINNRTNFTNIFLEKHIKYNVKNSYPKNQIFTYNSKYSFVDKSHETSIAKIHNNRYYIIYIYIFFYCFFSLLTSNYEYLYTFFFCFITFKTAAH